MLDLLSLKRELATEVNCNKVIDNFTIMKPEADVVPSYIFHNIPCQYTVDHPLHCFTQTANKNNRTVTTRIQKHHTRRRNRYNNSRLP